MHIESARVLKHDTCPGGYRALLFKADRIAQVVKPGQFVHLRVPMLHGHVLRRPFSVFDAEGDRLTVLYKPIGTGTRAMQHIAAGTCVNLLGPLGNGFPLDATGTIPVLVAGGYGVAPLRFLASRLAAKGAVFIGAATAEDILEAETFRAWGWAVFIATEDGSAGTQGLVTDALDPWLDARHAEMPPEFYACGPDGMLHAVADRAHATDTNAWLSLDKHMGCGVGACLACVQRVKSDDGHERWARVCRDGPVFESRHIVWTGSDAEPGDEPGHACSCDGAPP